MNCYELLKSKNLDFSSLLIEYYYLLDITETDVIILIKLENSSLQGLVNLEHIAQTTHLTLNDFTQRLNTLVDKGYITMELTDHLEEIYNFDNCYKRLAMAMDNESSQAKEESLEYELQGMMRLLEKEIGHTLSVLDKEIIRRWYKDYNYTSDMIKEALKVAISQHAVNIKYIDSVLSHKASINTSINYTNNSNNEIHPEIKDLIKNVVKK